MASRTAGAPMRVTAAAWLVIGSCLIGAGCSRESADSANASRAPKLAAGDSIVSLTVVAVRSGIGGNDLFQTFLEPEIDAPVVARHDGIVRAVLATEGRAVKAGQTLATLDSDEQRLDYERASAMSEQANAEYARAQKAITSNLISQHELEVKRAAAAAARADAARARLIYQRCTLRAPVSGVVRLARARPHMLVHEGEVLFRVAGTGRLRASLYLPSTQRALLAAGDTVRLRSLSEPSAPVALGRVRMANPMADPATGLCHIEIEAVHAPGLGPGDEVRIEIPTHGDAGTSGPAAVGAVLPRGAYLERDAAGLFVYRVRADRAERVPVDLGVSGVDGYGVIAGLAPGDLVVAAGQSPPAAGARVSPRLVGTR